MWKYAALSVILVFVAIGLFSIPLVIKYYIYVPIHEHVVRGDSVSVSGKYPHFWCEGQGLTSPNPFDAYAFGSVPEVDSSSKETTVSKLAVRLSNRGKEFLELHLLKGSNMSISACARLSGGSVSLVKGRRHLKRCLLEHDINLRPKEDSLEELSESQSDEATSSISSSQGVLSNETIHPYVCSTALEFSGLASAYRCNSPLGRFSRRHLFSHQAEKTDFYYLVFISDTYLDIIPNDFSLKLKMDRRFHDYKTSTSNCTNVTSCQLPLPLGSDCRIIVHTHGMNGSLQEQLLVSSCLPRRGVFLVFYLALAVMIFLCAFQ